MVEIEDAVRPRNDWKWTGSVLVVGYWGGPTHRTHHHSRRGSRSVPGVGVVGQCRMSGSSVTAGCRGRRSVPDVGQCRVVGTQDQPLAHGPGLLRCLIWAGCLLSTLDARLSATRPAAMRIAKLVDAAIPSVRPFQSPRRITIMEAHGDGIQQLLAAENEAQQIIKAAREVRSCCARVALVLRPYAWLCVRFDLGPSTLVWGSCGAYSRRWQCPMHNARPKRSG